MKSKDNLGDFIIRNYGEDFLNKIWSDKNEKTAFEYPPKGRAKVWFKCPKGIHNDEQRIIFNATKRGYKCKQCSIIEQHDKQRNDLVGKRFGKLLVTEYDRERSKDNVETFWFCDCDCGTKHKSVSGWALTKGTIQSCGCYHIEKISGENNKGWKGGITPQQMKIRGSKEYIHWRDNTFKKDNYTCQCCGQYGKQLNAHHILNFAEFDELRFDPSNAITLCEQCHAIKYPNSFHSIYGTLNNTPTQLEEYINEKRKQLGINIPFTIEAYKQGDILSPTSLLETTA